MQILSGVSEDELLVGETWKKRRRHNDAVNILNVLLRGRPKNILLLTVPWRVLLFVLVLVSFFFNIHEFYLLKNKKELQAKEKKNCKRIKRRRKFHYVPSWCLCNTYRACSIDRILTNVWVPCFKIVRNLLQIKYPNVYSVEVAQQ